MRSQRMRPGKHQRKDQNITPGKFYRKNQERVDTYQSRAERRRRRALKHQKEWVTPEEMEDTDEEEVEGSI